MNQAAKVLTIIVVVALLVIGYNAVYTVTEGQHALLLRLGKMMENPATKQPYVIAPGLHFKMPFVNQVRKFDTRLQTFTVQSSRILTQEQKYVLVDYYVKWRIENLPLFYQRTGGQVFEAQTLLQQQINDALRAAFGRRTITEVVSGERVDIMKMLRERANRSAQGLGIEVIDVRIKSIDLPKEVSESVFQRMRAQREQVATKHRADGKAQAERIRATADSKAAILIAQTRAKAQAIRASGVKQAAAIYNQAYQQAPGFYGFYRSLQAYRDSFTSKRDILLLSPTNAFFHYFKTAKIATGKS